MSEFDYVVEWIKSRPASACLISPGPTTSAAPPSASAPASSASTASVLLHRMFLVPAGRRLGSPLPPQLAGIDFSRLVPGGYFPLRFSLRAWCFHVRLV